MQIIRFQVITTAPRLAKTRSQLHRPAFRRCYCQEQDKSVTVHKFGGSSVGNANAIGSVSDIILRTDSRNVVVVSAMYGITDLLITGYRSLVSGDFKKTQTIKDEITRFHFDAVEELTDGCSDAEQKLTLFEVDRLINNHFQDLFQRWAKGGLNDSALDSFVILGEKLTSLLLTNYLLFQKKVNAKLVDASNFLRVDGKYGNSSPELKITQDLAGKKIVPYLQNDHVVVVPGFFGVDKDDNVKTLGRGGSDLTATTVGHAVNADRIALWKVECVKKSKFMESWAKGCVGVVNTLKGPYSKTISQLDYDSAIEMFKLGKKVVHPYAVFPALEKSIPIYIKNTLAPSEEGTLIGSSKAKKKESVLVVNPLDNLTEQFDIEPKGDIENSGDFSVFSIVGDGSDDFKDQFTEELDELEGVNVKPTECEIKGFEKTFSFLVPKNKENIVKNITLKTIHAN